MNKNIIELKPGPEGPICDFCSSPKVVWRYRAVSIGDWAACDECSALIETKDKMGLHRRSIETYLALNNCDNDMAKYLSKSLEILHSAFWLCKHGEREPAQEV
jgi:hypothetical protein